MTMKTRIGIAFAAGLASSLLACASSPKPVSPELVNARIAVRQAVQSPAARYVPDRLISAQTALREAEHAAHGSLDERTLAYVADRKAREVIAAGNMALAEQRMAIAKRDYMVALEADRKRLQQEQAQLAETERQLEAEREARAQAEHHTHETLKAIAKVKEDSRGIVVSLQGQVLFRTGESKLLPGAREQLNRVAEALKQTNVKRQIMIEGHTDSRGSAELNEQLSQKRAEAVRAYLIQRGLDPMMLSAIGKGEEQPVASNTSAEGRANNRRVELVIPIEPAATATRTPTKPKQ